ncbi:MAG: glycerate kinase [Burkholderiaceae bacterium]
MNMQKIIASLVVICLMVAAYLNFKWAGVAVVATGLVTWGLLHFSRMMQVLKRAADRPIGYVGSAVMLNAKLKPGATLLHVVAMTKALGELSSPKDEQPEIYRWTDGTQSHVTCEFMNGKLKKWTLVRPEQPDDATSDAASPAA